MQKRALICFMVLLLFPFAGKSEDVSVQIPSLWGSRSAALTMDARWFEASPYQYHHGLARLSLAMAVSAFPGSGAQSDAAMRSFFSQLHFSHAVSGSLAEQDTLNASIAWRTMGNFPVIAVAAGPASGEEWNSALDVGVMGDHYGFLQEGQRLVQRIRQLEERLGLSECRYWLSGFGRGGGVCQAAARILEGEGNAVFCYTFAAPRVCLKEQASVQSGVFNIISPTDPLALLPPRAWGFSWYGHALFFPFPQGTGSDDPQLLWQFQQLYSQFAGQNAAVWNPSLPAMAQSAVRQMIEECKNRAYYQGNVRTLLYKLFLGKKLTLSESLRAASLIARISDAAQKARGNVPMPPVPPGLALGSFASPALSVLYSQHDPALYASWMLSITDGNVLLGNTLSLTNMP